MKRVPYGPKDVMQVQKQIFRDRNEAKKKIPPKPAKEQSKINFKSRLLSHC